MLAMAKLDVHGQNQTRNTKLEDTNVTQDDKL